MHREVRGDAEVIYLRTMATVNHGGSHFPIKPFNSTCKFLFSSSTSDDLQMISTHGDRLDSRQYLVHTRFQLSNQKVPPSEKASVHLFSGPPPLPLPSSLSLSNCLFNPVLLLGTSVTHRKTLSYSPSHAQCTPSAPSTHPLQLQPPSFLFPIWTGANPPCRNERSGTVEMLRNLRRIRSGRVINQPVISPFPAEGTT